MHDLYELRVDKRWGTAAVMHQKPSVLHYSTCYEYEHRQKSLGNKASLSHVWKISIILTPPHFTEEGRQLFVCVTLGTARQSTQLPPTKQRYFLHYTFSTLKQLNYCQVLLLHTTTLIYTINGLPPPPKKKLIII